MKLDGFGDLEKQIEKLTKAAGKGVIRRSLKKAAVPMVELAADLAAKKSGALSKSIAVSSKLDKRQAGKHRKMFKDDKAAVEMFIGPSLGIGKGGRHGHLVEFGTKPHMNGGTFAGTFHPGTAPQPFMRPAWDQDHEAMLKRLGQDIWSEVSKSLDRAARKAAKG
jgi:HK97 gp10 family phage protein